MLQNDPDSTLNGGRGPRLVCVESGLTGLESVVVLVSGEVKRAAAPGSVRGRAGTL